MRITILLERAISIVVREERKYRDNRLHAIIQVCGLTIVLLMLVITPWNSASAQCDSLLIPTELSVSPGGSVNLLSYYVGTGSFSANIDSPTGMCDVNNATSFDVCECGQYEVSVTAFGTTCDILLDIQYAINLEIASPSIYYDPEFGANVLCTSTNCETVLITDLTAGISPGSDYSYTITDPSGNVVNESGMASNYEYEMCEYGLYVIEYVVVENGCETVHQEGIFFGNSDVSTDFNFDAVIPTFNCEGDELTFEVCSGCENPYGTQYTVEMDCVGFLYETLDAPFTVTIPMDSASCNYNSGGQNGDCGCTLSVFAWNPCAGQLSNVTSPVKITPQVDASFAISPGSSSNVYCPGELDFYPLYSETDCNGANPAPSICDIVNPEWEITPAVGWTISSGGLDQEDLELDFTDFGTYEVCFSWSNQCDEGQTCQEICIVENIENLNEPVVWGDAPDCVGDVFQPTLNLGDASCNDFDIEWEVTPVDGVDASGLTGENPTFTFNEKGSYSISVEVNSDCGDLEESFNFEINGAPLIAFEPCLQAAPGAELCLGEFVTIDDCGSPITNTEFLVDGSTYENPIPPEPCLSFGEGTVNFEVETTNACGTTTESTDVVISENNLCTVITGDALCAGESISPSVAGGTNCTWFESLDGVTYNAVGVPFQPDPDAFYYADCSNGGDCGCLSDTVSFEVDAIPDIDIVINPEFPCAGDTVIVTLTNTLYNYTWDNTGVQNQPLEITDFDDEIDISVTIDFSPSCDPINIETTIEAEPNPLLIDCASLPNPLCGNGEPFSLPAVNSNDGITDVSGGTWQILDDQGTVLETDPDNISPEDLGNGDFTLVYSWESLNGCPFSDECDITVLLTDELCSIEVGEGICAGEDLVPSVNGGVNCTWYESADGVNFIQVDLPLNPTPDMVYFADCQSGGCGCVTDTVSFDVDEVPDINLLVQPTEPCAGDTLFIALDNTSFDYSWIGFGVENEPLEITNFNEELFVSVSIDYSPLCDPLQLETNITAEANPLEVQCSGIPQPICSNGTAVPLPDVVATDGTTDVSGGSWQILDNEGDVVQMNPNEIGPQELGTGTFTLIYTWQSANGCDFTDQCEFEISVPQPTEIVVPTGLYCFGTALDFDEANGYDVIWSVDGCSEIGNDGLLNSEDCAAGSTVFVSVQGNCLIPDTVDVEILEIPVLEVGELGPVCYNECLSLTPENVQLAETIEWTVDGNVVEDPLCPEDLDFIAAGQSFQLNAVAIHENGCEVYDSTLVEVAGLPELTGLPDTICLNSTLSIPDCPTCDPGGTLSIEHEDSGAEINIDYPGDTQVSLPEPGDYVYTIIGVLGNCEVSVQGAIHVISLPEVEVFQPEYDDCLINYEVEVAVSGEDSVITWSNPNIGPTLVEMGNGNLAFTIYYPDTSDINYTYIDTIVVTNQCSADTAIIESDFTALPGFSVDNDSLICSGTYADFNIDLLFPVTVDEFVVTSDYPGFETTTFEGAPPEVWSYLVETDNSQQTYNFTFEAFNHCGSIVSNAQVVVYPADLVFDVELHYEVPFCEGDTLVAELVEVFGDQYPLQFDNLNEGHLTLVGSDDNEFYFVLNDVPDGTYYLEASMQSSNCPVILDSDPILVGPTIDVQIPDRDDCPAAQILMSNINYVQDGTYQWTNYGAVPPFTTEQEVPVLYFPFQGEHAVILEADHEDYCPQSDTAIVTIHSDDFLYNIINEPSQIDPYEPYMDFEFTASEEVVYAEWYNFSNDQVVIGETARLHFDTEPCYVERVKLVGESQFGCVDSLTKRIVAKGSEVFLPNAITPDEDGLNDVFSAVFPESLEFKSFEIKIVSRSGTEVFHSTDPNFSWTGDDRVNNPVLSGNEEHFVKDDVYVWTMHYIIQNSDVSTCDKVRKVGHVVVIR